MKTVSRQRVIDETVYITEDGQEFFEAHSAKVHEWRCNATKVYIYVARGRRYSRGDYENPAIYSSKEKALKDSEHYGPEFYIQEVNLDERLM